jgi:hypothetical protein
MLKFSKLVYFFATLISTVAVASGEARVLRSNTNSQTGLVFKDAEALSQFNRLADSTPQAHSSLRSNLRTIILVQLRVFEFSHSLGPKRTWGTALHMH